MPTLQDEMLADAAGPSDDKLDRVRKLTEKARDLELTITDIEQTLKDTKEEYQKLRMETLPRVFNETGIQRLDLSAQGNLPACTAILSDYYKANIASDWGDEQKDKAFAFLEKQGYGDLIKNVIEIRLGMEENKLYKKIMTALRKLKVRPLVRRSVPWNSLTAMIRETYEEGEQMSDAELSMLGAFVGQVVEIKPVKEK